MPKMVKVMFVDHFGRRTADDSADWVDGQSIRQVWRYFHVAPGNW